MSNNNFHEYVIESIYLATIKLLDTKDLKDISITEIIKKAGVSRMSFYRNFKRKEDILINHLVKFVKESNILLQTKNEVMTPKTILKHIIDEMAKDNIMYYIIKNDLFLECFKILKDNIISLYVNNFGVDKDDKEMIFQIYYMLGSFLGIRMYLIYEGEIPEKSKEKIANIFDKQL